MRRLLSASLLLLAALPAHAQDPTPCRFLCTPEFKVEPTITFEPLFNSPRIVEDDGGPPVRDRRETDFELVLSVGLPTRMSWLDFTIEAIFLPFDRDSTPDLEFETNLVWLPASRTRGWLTSHFDVVDQFSPAERPGDRRAYTHKLNFELDTSVAVFNWLPEGRWLRWRRAGRFARLHCHWSSEGGRHHRRTTVPRQGESLVVFNRLRAAGRADVKL